MSYNITMKKNIEKQSFEIKIRKSFIKYGRIPFIMLITIIVLLITYDQLISPIIFSKVAQSKVEKEIDVINDDLEVFLESMVNVESNEEFYNKFYNFTSVSGIKGSVIIYDQDFKVTYITQPSIEGSMYNRVYNRAFLERVNNSPQKAITTSANLDAINTDFNTLMFGYCGNNDNGEVVSIIYYLDKNIIQNIIQHQSVNHVVVTDTNNYVVGTTSQVFVGQINRFNNVTNDVRLKADYKVYSKPILDNTLSIYTLLIKKPILEQYGLLFVLTSIVLFGYRLANRRVAQRVGQEVAQSINKLLVAVNKIKEGDLSVKVDINSNDELEVLADELNIMTTQLSNLIDRNQKLLELRKNAQIKQLEAQFNPHFLYNSLETTRYLITFNPNKAQDMILNITNLLRYSIDGSENMVTFRKDLEYLKLYLNINKVRLDEKFNYSIDVTEEVLSVIMPKLMIQPLIENSIKHGYRHNDNLTLKIIGFSDNDYIYIKVIDDGSGMDDNTLKTINKLISEDGVESKTYGLHSIIKRLNLIYGDKSKINIESSNKGTTVTLIVPKNMLDKEKL